MVQIVSYKGEEHEFPDEATPEMMKRALQSQVDPRMEAFKQATGQNRTPGSTLKDIGVGLGEAGQNIASLLTGGYAPRVNMQETIGAQDPNKLIQGMAQYAPFGMAAPAGLAGQVGAGAAFGASQAQPGERMAGGFKDALINALTHGAFKGAEALRPSRFFRGQASPETLQANVEAARGTTTPLGDVIQSPALKRTYENVLPHVPFGGTHDVMQQTANQLKQTGENLIEKLGGKQTETKPLQDALKESLKVARQEKRTNYNAVNDIADEIKLTVPRANFSNEAKTALQEIEQSPELKREFPQDLLGDLQQYAVGEKGNTLKLSNIFKGKLGDKANEFYRNGKMYEYGLINNLKDALGRDINESIEQSGNERLKGAYTKAQKEYAEKYAPFEDPDITKFTRRGGDPDLILQHFLRTGSTSQRGQLLEKVISKLRKEEKGLPLRMYLTKAIENGELNPVKLHGLYNKLGEKQKDLLINDKSLRKELENYVKSIGMNKEAFQTMYNPKTGQRNLESLSALLQGLSGFSMGSAPGAMAAIGGPALLARGANSMLTSPSLRESLVKAMIENKRWNPKAIPGLQAGAQSAANR